MISKPMKYIPGIVIASGIAYYYFDDIRRIKEQYTPGKKPAFSDKAVQTHGDYNFYRHQGDDKNIEDSIEMLNIH